MPTVSRSDLTLDVADIGGVATLTIDLGGGWTASHDLDLRRLPIRAYGPAIYQYRGRRRKTVEPAIVRRGALSRPVREWAGEMIYQHMTDAREAVRAFVQAAAEMQEDAEKDAAIMAKQAAYDKLDSDHLRPRVRTWKTLKDNAQSLADLADGIADNIGDNAAAEEYMIMSRAGRPPAITSASIITATAKASQRLGGAHPTTQQVADAHDPPVSRTHLARRRAALTALGELN